MNFRDCFNLTSSPNSMNSKHTSTQFTNKTWGKHNKPWEKWVEKESRAKAGTHGRDIYNFRRDKKDHSEVMECIYSFKMRCLTNDLNTVRQSIVLNTIV